MLDLSLLPELQYNGEPALPPQKADLERLYNLIIKHRSTTVLEFGCGYSTLVIEQALRDNHNWFDNLEHKPNIRNNSLWFTHSVDTNLQWVHELIRITKRTILKYTECSLSSYNGRYCHTYNELPSITPDFIYLDGPDPTQVNGFKNFTPISADILYLEPILLPGTIVLIDGRTNNARFLENNLQRNWKIEWNSEEDYTLMELDEPSLGKVIANGRDILEWLKISQ